MAKSDKKEVKILRSTDFSQKAYLERRKQYLSNMEKYLNDKIQNEKDKK